MESVGQDVGGLREFAGNQKILKPHDQHTREAYEEKCRPGRPH
jgi:hypothetical protein